jgi:hypothetical protein
MKHEGYELTFVKARLDLDPARCKAVASRKLTMAADEAGLNSVDLLPVKFILVSEHENDNGDCFLRSELIQARVTPRCKPFNIEHMVEEAGSYITQPLFNASKNTIIGHITDSYLAAKDGTVISEDDLESFDATDNVNRTSTESIDVIATAVLYSFYFPKTVSDIEIMASQGNMFVSMECWFKGHDYMVGSEIKPYNKVLEQDWKRKKMVCGRRVSRVLRNLMFGGVAATETPANKDSIFLSAASANLRDAELKRLHKRHNELHILYDATLSNVFESEHLEVTRAIATLENHKNKIEK